MLFIKSSGNLFIFSGKYRPLSGAKPLIKASLKEKMISILILILVIWFFVSYESEEWEGFCYELSNGKTQCYSEKQFEDMVDDASNKKY